MQSGIYVSLSSQMALERRLTTIADNMANVNTTGFRGTEVKFNQVLSNTDNKLGSKVAFVTQGNDYLSSDNGELQNTGSSFDFAVKGEAWFGINTPAGTVLTRDGRFSMTSTGALVSERGFPVLDPNGGQIQLNPQGGEPSVTSNGEIFQNNKQMGTIGLYSADISKGFVRYSNSGVIPVETPQAVVDSSKVGIAQGYLENSNVNGMREMTQLIEVSRAFDNISTLTGASESSLQEAIKTLGSKSS
ncbi:flagellar basal-body rod protein FlgF [Rhizobium sp. HT1-10]|uniref:flagellar basal-body rod protein FlgF n=1 Tax=Rhizobium sp. HT1-10 TaxID=3111638 RepID=UPI003C22A5C4